jgi:hypothetical protein
MNQINTVEGRIIYDLERAEQVQPGSRGLGVLGGAGTNNVYACK